MFLNFRRYNHKQLTAIYPWRDLNHSYICQFRGKLLNYCPSDILVRNFTTTEYQRHLSLVTFFKESTNMLNFEIEVMIIGFRPDLYLFNLHLNLFFLCFLLFLTLLILELAVIHDPANRWSCRRRHLNQIKLACFSSLQRLAQRQNSQLLTIVCYNTYF